MKSGYGLRWIGVVRVWDVVRRVVLVLVAVVLGAAGLTSVAVPAGAVAPSLIGDEPTDGTVRAIAVAGDGSTYLAGSFSTIGAATGSGAGLALSDGAVNRAFPAVAGSVYDAAPDGSGGFFIGGAFSSVGGVPRANVAHILADGSVDAFWAPNPNSTVEAVAVSGSTVYLGGGFTALGGQSRNYAAAVGTDGVVTGWSPWLDNYVYEVLVSGSTVYLGGSFNYVNNYSFYRSRLAAVGATDGVVTDWQPNPNSNVNALALSGAGTTLYVGGDFTSIGAGTPASRSRLAAVNTSDGVATSWAPSSNSTVDALAVVGTNVFAGGAGTFSSGATSRDYVAKINSAGSVATWNAQANGPVYGLAVSSTTLFAGGSFTSLVGTARTRMASLTTGTTANVNAWNPGGADSTVYSLAVSGSTVFSGGDFRHVNLRSRSYSAGLDASGVLTAWNPAPNGEVLDVAVSGSTVYLGGNFSQAGGQARSFVGAVDTTTGTATAWNPGTNNAVYALEVSGSTVYLGGYFSQVGGQTRGMAAAVDTAGTVTAWDPMLCQHDWSCGYSGYGPVHDIAVSGSTVYLAGSFQYVNTTVPRSNLAAVNVSDAAVTAFAPNPNGEVRDIAVSGSQVFASGSFNTIGGQGRTSLGAVDTTTGTATAWNPAPNASSMNALEVSGSTVYVGGYYLTSVGGQPRNGVAALNTTDGAATAWNPGVYYYQTVEALSVAGSGATSRVYMGGDFDYVGGWLVRPSYGQFAVLAGALPPAPTNGAVSGGKASWSPAMIGGLQFYLVSYRPVGQSRWGLYGFGGTNNGLVLNNPGDPGVCSAENNAAGYTECPMPYGWVSGTTYEFTVAARTVDGRNSPGPQTVKFTYTAP